MRFIVQGTDYDCGYYYDKEFLLLITLTFHIVTKLSSVELKFWAIQVIQKVFQ